MTRFWLAAVLTAAIGWTAGLALSADTPTPTEPSQPSVTKTDAKPTDAKPADAPAKSDSSKSEATKPEGKLKGRLPPYYGKVVDADQKQKIYEIQSNFDPKLKELRKQISELTAQRDEQVKAVLTTEQQAKIADLAAEARIKRGRGRHRPVDARATEVKSTDAKSADTKPADSKPSDSKSTDAKPTDPAKTGDAAKPVVTGSAPKTDPAPASK